MGVHCTLLGRNTSVVNCFLQQKGASNTENVGPEISLGKDWAILNDLISDSQKASDRLLYFLSPTTTSSVEGVNYYLQTDVNHILELLESIDEDTLRNRMGPHLSFKGSVDEARQTEHLLESYRKMLRFIGTLQEQQMGLVVVRA